MRKRLFTRRLAAAALLPIGGTFAARAADFIVTTAEDRASPETSAAPRRT